jgi:integrase/recombinase XerD
LGEPGYFSRKKVLSMEEVVLSIRRKKSHDYLFVSMRYNRQLIDAIKRIENMRWSATDRAWVVIWVVEKYEEIKAVLGDKARVNDVQVSEYLEKERRKMLSAEVVVALEKFGSWLRSKRYSENTVKVYLEALRVFLRYYRELALESITEEHVIRFNNEYLLAKKLSNSYQNQMVNGIKLFFSTVENRRLNPELVHRPRREHRLPNVLSKEEVKRILESLGNLKHRSMLSLIYACGLRRGELLNLKLKDIDAERKVLIIRQAKGKKDRMVPISEKILAMLREQYKVYKPKEWLFEGVVAGERYSERSLEKVLKLALNKTGIAKPVTLHWLRHSYATHLLETGVDIRFIQELLGHRSTRTTEIYTHVSTRSLQQIASPFDSL